MPSVVRIKVTRLGSLMLGKVNFTVVVPLGTVAEIFLILSPAIRICSAICSSSCEELFIVASPNWLRLLSLLTKKTVGLTDVNFNCPSAMAVLQQRVMITIANRVDIPDLIFTLE